ncbi:hypothetical protein GCM10010038_21400 [Glutamicibacter protophormiae]|nr:hypothetical protein GCM10010038_21400 [Glutamicibacter protophormiae]
MSRLIRVLWIVEGEDARAARTRYRLVSDLEAGTRTVASSGAAAKGAGHHRGSTGCEGVVPVLGAVLIGLILTVRPGCCGVGAQDVLAPAGAFLAPSRLLKS